MPSTPSAYVSIRQHTSAHVSGIHLYAAAEEAEHAEEAVVRIEGAEAGTSRHILDPA
jgi:hypothetical protein